jgi:plasmid stabilization system protein ParE
MIKTDAAVRDRSVAANLGTVPRVENGPLSTYHRLPYREVYVKPYRFFYRIHEKTAWVVAVWHGAQIPHDPEDASDPRKS